MTNILWSPGMTIDELERLVYTSAYRFYGGNKKMAAASLGVAELTVTNHLSKYELEAIEEETARASREEERERQLRRARGIMVSSNFANAATPSTEILAKRPEPAPVVSIKSGPLPTQRGTKSR